MVTRLGLITVLTIAALLPVPALAQDAATTNMEILRQKVKADKKLVVAENLQLTDAEGDCVLARLRGLSERSASRSISGCLPRSPAYADAYNKGPVANDVAKKLLDEAMAIDDAELQLRKSATPKVMAALPAAKAARYIQIENKIRAVIRYELAANIPLVE